MKCLPQYCSYIWLFLIWVVTSLSIPAATYYVGPDGRDGNEGSQTHPFRQIRQGVAVAEPGDEVLVADGEYLGFNVFEKGDRVGEPIVVRAVGDAAVVIPTTDRERWNNPYNIVIWRSENVVIEGLRTFGAEKAGCRIVESDFITIRGCTFGDHGIWGFVTSFSNNLLLENNECFGSRGEHGIYVANSGDHPTVRGNRLHGNAGSGLRMNGDVTQGGDGLITGALIEQNILYANGAAGGGAVNLNGVQDAVIRNNLLYNNDSTGIALFQGGGAAGPAGIEILHNTIDLAPNARYALRMTDVAGPITVRNNILYNRNTAKGPFSWKSAADSEWTTSDHNIFAGGLVVTNDNEQTDLGLSAWQATGNDQNSLVITDPATLFLDLAGRDYRLKTGSAAIDAGAAAGVSTDLAGANRPVGSAPDIGAFEVENPMPPDSPRDH